ncbi:type IV pilus modification protein PilV [Neisseria mucosa ATCC 25996]|uniref:Type IV pilus modification protein PilV n=1 Tax=Neisseria mucosa (strain ATCC 25996 / DSM 4631 / NCTC 10774 / M26) TaxID=546266 RepID=D2ZV83_NEIM2|nr:type IV pilus modification protein PilV [Neisseria mucosa]EFC88864.1 type IV pilus modification protein PilV [Neisseria mucosa ATCC 25996]SUA93906.1 putative type IV pilus assembly protein PilV [Neisseria mucosa]
MKYITLHTKGRLKTSKASFAKTRYSDFYKPKQAGMTLIEVLVAMFVLAIGVLALLAIQLRTVSSVREAEGQTIVSQLTQNLVEGMLINPRLEKCDAPQTGATTSGRDRGWCKNYSDYYTTYGDSSTEPLKKGPVKVSMSKEELANAQLGQFHDALDKAFRDSDISDFYYVVCRDGKNKEPTFKGGKFKPECHEDKTADTVIKVLWLKDAENDKAASSKSDDPIVYTYQVRVRER